jgi:uncharacterized repeat protein (TIGR02543 family)
MARKIFEVNDVLPATTQLRISWADMIRGIRAGGPSSAIFPTPSNNGNLKSDNNSFAFFTVSGDYFCLCGIPYYFVDSALFLAPYTDASGNHPYVDIDTSNWTVEKRTISSYENSTSDYTYNLTWEDLAHTQPGYTIAFNSNGGSSISPINNATELPASLPTPTKSGYVFGGWYYDSSFTNRAFAGDPLTGNVTLHAKWQLNAYTITYNSNGGSGIPQTSDATQLPNPLPTPTKSGYIFAGWYYDSSFTQKANAGDTIVSNVTLHAKWQLNAYTITFEENGGSEQTDLTEQTALPNPLPIPTRSGYLFVNWYYDSALTQIASPGDPIESNVTLYAGWRTTTQTSIRIYNGTDWFTLDGYSSYDCLNSLTYVNAPERTIGGTIPNLSSIPTFIVTTLFITYKLMPYQTYKDFISHINNKVEFVIEYFDVDTGSMMTKKFYLAPQSQRELFYARRGGVRTIDGILNITLEFISTNNEV